MDFKLEKISNVKDSKTIVIQGTVHNLQRGWYRRDNGWVTEIYDRLIHCSTISRLGDKTF